MLRPTWVGLCAAITLVTVSIACDSTSVTSPDPFVVVVEPSEASLAIGESVQLTATVRNKDGDLLTDQPVSWEIDEPSVATLSSGGRVEGVGAGTATVTATSGPASGDAQVVVQPSGQ